METSFKQTTSNKVERYRLFLPQFELLISDEKEEISVLANTAAALREAFGFFWVGFYLVKDDQLILGPFQGSTACYRIHKGKGVCGTSWAEARTLIVPNVEQFPGHIACSSLSRRVYGFQIPYALFLYLISEKMQKSNVTSFLRVALKKTRNKSIVLMLFTTW